MTNFLTKFLLLLLLLVGVCYRTVNKEIFGDSTDDQLLELVRELQGKHVMLMGDFSYPDIVWSTHHSQSHHGQSFVDAIDDCFLTQHVNAATRGDSVLDLVFTDEPIMIDNVGVMSCLGNSDHNVLF